MAREREILTLSKFIIVILVKRRPVVIAFLELTTVPASCSQYIYVHMYTVYILP